MSKPYILLDLPVCDPNKIFTAEGDNLGVVAPEMSRRAISLALLLVCERDGLVWILRQIFLTNIRLLLCCAFRRSAKDAKCNKYVVHGRPEYVLVRRRLR
jgi:hypothetical protein